MIEKKLSPKGRSMKVTFRQPASVADESIAVVGDFNDWDSARHEMKLSIKNGEWSRTISMKPGNAYEFRYLVDGREWKNDDQADRFVRNMFLGENGVLDL